ncbi:MAG TPA: phytanoyl-CoA dioxygenase family protein, partial [Ktedonobacteraceae bacterium]|nr:phytanoyl-CoA dioxygenase family protein [Ktedonobacteraceae bacterium]
NTLNKRRGASEMPLFDQDASTFPLTTEQAESYHHNGYLAVEQLVPAVEVNWMIPLSDPLFAEHPHPDIPGRVNGPAHLDVRLVESLAIHRMISVAQQLLNSEVIYLGDWLLDKRPGDPETVWHQDEWRRGQEWPLRYVETWLAIDDAEEDNGCIQVIPYSHTHGVIPRPSEEFDALVASGAKICNIPAGGCLFWSARTLHYAGLNRSKKPRRAYSFSFGALEQRLLPDFLARWLFSLGQEVPLAPLQQLALPVESEPELTLKHILDDTALFRRFLSEPAGQIRLRRAIAEQVQKPNFMVQLGRREQPMPTQSQIVQRQQAQQQRQRMMKERKNRL